MRRTTKFLSYPSSQRFCSSTSYSSLRYSFSYHHARHSYLAGRSSSIAGISQYSFINSFSFKKLGLILAGGVTSAIYYFYPKRSTSVNCENYLYTPNYHYYDYDDHSSLDSHSILVHTSLQVNPIEVLVNRIKKCKHSLKAVVYKFENEQVYSALVDAIQRGVNVKLIFDSHENKKQRSPVYKLMTIGAVVHFWDNSKMPKLHAKLAIIDDDYVLCGSSNWTENEGNVELVLEFTGTHVKGFCDQFVELWEKS